MSQVQVDGLTINYDVQGDGDPLLLIPYPLRRPRLLCVPGAGLCPALPLHRDRSSRLGRQRQAAPAPTRPRPMPTRSPPSSTRGGRATPTSPGSRSAPPWACILPPVIQAACARSRCTAPGTPAILYLKTVVEDVAHARVDAPDHRGHGDPGNLPARASPQRCTPTRPEFVDTLTDFVRSRPAQPLDAFLAQTEAAITHDAGAGAGRDRGSDPDHRRGARPRLLATLRRAAQHRDRAEANWSSSSISRTQGCTRTPRPSTARRSTSCCASARDRVSARRPARRRCAGSRR